MKDIINELKAINDEVVSLQVKADDKRKAAYQPFLDALAASGEVSLILIYGYTPGFNDGEPCEHSYNYVINIADALSADFFEDGSFEGVNLDGFEWVDELESCWPKLPTTDDKNTTICAEHGHIYNRASEEIAAAIGNVIVDTHEATEGTDYWVVYVLKDGKFEMQTGHYDCGY